MKKLFVWGNRNHRRVVDKSKDHVMFLLYDLMVDRVEDHDYEAMKKIEELADIFVDNGHKELRAYMFNYFVSRLQLEDGSIDHQGLDIPDVEIVPMMEENNAE